MSYSKWTTAAMLIASVCITACNRKPGNDAARTGEANRVAATDAQRDRDEDVNRLEKRLDDLDQKWAGKEQKLAQERATATAAMRAEVKQDIQNARMAVADLRTTTPENWWEREEGVLERTTAELERDVQHFTGKPKPSTRAANPKPAEETGTAFAARRDRFLNQLQPRVDAMKERLEAVKAKGTDKTERDDTLARVKKVDNDIAELRKASPDDWWKISKQRVTDYIDRLDHSISRLDDNKPKT